MNDIAWKIIDGLCHGIGVVAVLIIIFGEWKKKDIIHLGLFVVVSFLLLIRT